MGAPLTSRLDLHSKLEVLKIRTPCFYAIPLPDSWLPHLPQIIDCAHRISASLSACIVAQGKRGGPGGEAAGMDEMRMEMENDVETDHTRMERPHSGAVNHDRNLEGLRSMLPTIERAQYVSRFGEVESRRNDRFPSMLAFESKGRVL